MGCHRGGGIWAGVVVNRLLQQSSERKRLEPGKWKQRLRKGVRESKNTTDRAFFVH